MIPRDMNRTKTILFLGDGMADEPLPELGGKTPLEYAVTPGMDAIAAAGACGTLFTLPEAFPTSSDVANMSVLGCDLSREYAGRGVLEAASRGIPMKPSDVAFRVNLTTVQDGILKDFSGGHIAQADAEVLIEALNKALGSESIRFHAGVSYRNLLVLSHERYHAAVDTEKPDDHQGDPVEPYLPKAAAPEGEETARLIRSLMQEASKIIAQHPLTLRAQAEGRPFANAVWIWSGGSPAGFRTLQQRYGISAAVISAVDVINGLGRCLGMDVIRVPGATGYIDTNYEGKADAAVKAIESHDFVYLHVEAIDEVSHAMDLNLKIETIEAFDRRVVTRVLDQIQGLPVTRVVLPDHPVPIRLGKHTRTPVPVAIAGPGWKTDAVRSYGEQTCPTGALGAMVGSDLMNRLFAQRDR